LQQLAAGKLGSRRIRFHGHLLDRRKVLKVGKLETNTSQVCLQLNGVILTDFSINQP
jgi:hypothetical protein